MKRIISGLLLLTLAVQSQAQTPKKKTHTKPAATKKAKPVKMDTTSSISLVNASEYRAYGDNRLSIADPTINAFNMNASSPNGVNSSRIAGTPKGTYGFANGKLFLRSTTATTSGGSYGSGSVGTGTSIQGTGTSEATIGVNGKAPYASTSLWGDKQPIYKAPLRTDSTRNR